MRTDVLAGIFVGGASSRMGRAKGLIEVEPGVTLVDRWRTLFAELSVEHVLVGRRAEYAELGVVTLADEPPGIGPLGGLASLLAAARGRRALVVACDMPFLTSEDVALLLATPGTAAARRDGRWEPFFAIYAPSALLVVRRHIQEGSLSLQALLDELAPRELPIASERLADWDTPQDVPTSAS